MAKFNGSNKIESTKTLFYERLDYNYNAFAEREGAGPIGVTDLNFFEKSYYGRVDVNLNSVVPDTQHIAQLKYAYNVDITHGAMDFVVDAFYNLTTLFKNASNDRRIPADDINLSMLVGKKAYSDPLVDYREYIQEMLNIFTNIYIPQNNLGPSVMNVKSFADNLMIFIDRMTDHYPITLTGWHRSNRASPFYSGLFINLASYALDQDSFKEMQFINKPVFDFYVNACVNNGFMVSHKNPSIICADLGSPAMKPHLKKHGIEETYRIFTDKYKQTHSIDIDEIKRMLFTGFNDFVNIRSFERERNYCERSNKMLSRIKTRNTINIDTFNNIINNKYLINYYINIRNIEENKVFAITDLKRIQRQAIFFEKKFDINKAISYINEQFRSTFKSKVGGINWLTKWISDREKHRRLEG